MKTNKLLTTLAIISVVLISGCKKDMYVEKVGKCPIVVSTSPANGDTNISVYKIITAKFNEDMNPLTITQASFTIQGSPAITGTVTYADSIATFTPASPLTANHTYTGRITTASRDLNGNALQKDYVWTFTTNANLAPTVIYTDPKNNDTAVFLNKKITAIFSVPMNQASIISPATFTIKQTSNSAQVLGAVSYSNSTAIFTPTVNLLPSTQYTATITTAAKNLAGTSMANNYVWVFTTGALIAPTVIYTSPANNDTGVVLNKIVTATFSVMMNQSTIIAVGTFTIKQTSNSLQVAGGVTYSSTTAIFTPTSNLLPGTNYTATITTAAKNFAGTPMANNYVWTFTTLTMNAPTVIYTDPKSNDTGVVLNKNVTAIFSVPMNSSTIMAPGTFTIKQTSNSLQVLGAVSYSGSTAIFNPTNNFLPGTDYTATITTAAKNLAGTPMTANYVWTFKTLSLIAPTVIYTDPKNNDTGVVLNKNITAIFSMPMNQTTITALGTFTLKRGLITVAGAVSYSSSTAIFNPTNDLLPGTVYTAKITIAAKNLAGTPMAIDYIWTFKTIVIPSTAPLVISTDPQDLDTGVLVNKTVTASFNMPMKLSSIIALGTFTLKLGLTTVAGVVTYVDTTASFNPTTDLLFDTTYTATISTAAQNVAGTPMVNPYVWTFRTQKDTVTTVDILKSAARFGAFGGNAGITNQGLNTVINNGGIGTTAASTLITGFHDAITADVYTETPLNEGHVSGGIYTAPPAPGTATSFAIAQAGLQDANDAYLSISPASMPLSTDPGAELGGLTLAPGVYESASGSFKIENGNLTLDAQGDPNAMWVFQAATSLSVGIAGPTGARSITIINGGFAKNVYWYVGSAATINAAGGGIMVGNIIAYSGVTFSTPGNAVQTVLNGRAISLVASVTMVNTTINVPLP